MRRPGKTTAYISCFIDISLYNNFNEENKAPELWEKIDIMLENKNAVNRVSVFQKIVRLRYQDGSCMAEHMNAFQGKINQTTSRSTARRRGSRSAIVRIPSGQVGDANCHVRQHRTGRETLILARVKSSLLNEEARLKDRESGTNTKALSHRK